jgi:hypothetical protein
MSNGVEITLFTSIPPHMSRPFAGRDFGVAWQTACIASWRSAGFHNIISLNAAEEIRTLRGKFAQNVTFIELPSNRTRALIADLLAAPALCNSTICGIINADVLMAPHPGIIRHLTEDLNGLAIAERISLNRYTLHPTGLPCMGFDAFFFKTDTIARLNIDQAWRIGDTWWDYWLPLAFQAAGFQISTFPSPILVHLDHEQAWNWHTWQHSFPRLLHFLKSSDFDHPVLVSAIDTMPDEYDAEHIHAFIAKIYAWLCSRAPLWQPEAGSVDDLFTALLHALRVPPLTPAAGRGRVMLRRLINRFHLHPAMKVLGFH